MSKELLFKSEAQSKLLHGASLLTDAIRITLGPKSKSVLIGKSGENPLFVTME